MIELKKGSLTLFFGTGDFKQKDFNVIETLCKESKVDLFKLPETNRHPKNQRKYALLIARLINQEITCAVITHSDYFVKEINILIMLNGSSKHAEKVRKQYNYDLEVLLPADKVKAYVICNGKFFPCEVNSELGIEAVSFDDVINEMNRIQEAILFGD